MTAAGVYGGQGSRGIHSRYPDQSMFGEGKLVQALLRPLLLSPSYFLLVVVVEYEPDGSYTERRINCNVCHIRNAQEHPVLTMRASSFILGLILIFPSCVGRPTKYMVGSEALFCWDKAFARSRGSVSQELPVEGQMRTASIN